MSERRGFRGPGPGGHGMGLMEKPKDFKGSIRKLSAYIGRYRIQMALVVVSALASTVFTIVGPKISGQATTLLFSGLMAKLSGAGGIDFPAIARILLLTLGLYLTSSGFSFLQGWLMTGITQKVSYSLRLEISKKLDRLPMKYFESRTVGDVLSRITNDVDTLGQSLNQSITQLITGVASIIGVTVMMLTISPLMTLIALVILPVSAGLVALVVKKSQKYFRSQQETLGKINGQVEETFSGLNVVKAFGREEASREEFHGTNKLLWESAWKSQFLSGLMQPIMMFVGNLGYVLVAVIGSLLAVRGAITVGDIQAFIQYMRSFTQPIQQMAQVTNMLQSMAAAGERVFDFLAEPEEDASGAQVPEKVEGHVTFEHVRFGYDLEKPVIHDFNCEVKPGQMVAIVGPTGAGKTTMVKLLMRFYDLAGGRILIDGVDIKSYDAHQLRSRIGMVLQDTWLFKGTIMENLRYGRLEASDEAVMEAAKAAHAHNFIRTLPGGYQMELGEEATNVSQGQKQLLTIARAILADRPILVLDEATSSVDTRTESRIQRAMAALMKGRTSFVIAHRLSTIRDADLILVMKDGDIVEQGTHDELLACKGFYCELYNSQFEAAS